MKKLLLLACLAGITFFNDNLYSQVENTLPETGNVGIGTLNPSSKLDVNGHVKIDSTLLVKDSIHIQKDARVGQDLKIEGQVYIPNMEFTNNLNNQELLLKVPNGQIKSTEIKALTDYAYQVKECTDGDITSPYWQNGINKIFVHCPQIRVGISTSTPRSSLDVLGTTATKKLAIGIDPAQMVGGFHYKHFANAGNTETIFVVENNERRLFQINNDGIVRSREVMVNLEIPWPDYVFQKDYPLIPLNEVGKYIDQNGHLPNVPSAADVEQNGVGLGQMQQVLLEKVEELTLYILEQEKRISELEEQLKNK